MESTTKYIHTYLLFPVDMSFSINPTQVSIPRDIGFPQPLKKYVTLSDTYLTATGYIAMNPCIIIQIRTRLYISKDLYDMDNIITLYVALPINYAQLFYIRNVPL